MGWRSVALSLSHGHDYAIALVVATLALSWLFIGYLLQTTGELCLSPVGLSMITKLTPAFLVSTVMGTWFLASAAGNFMFVIFALTQVLGVGTVALISHAAGQGLIAYALAHLPAAFSSVSLLFQPVIVWW